MLGYSHITTPRPPSVSEHLFPWLFSESLSAHLQSSVFKLSKDLIAVTGHTSPAMLKKYIKAENLKVVEKLTDKYDYFR